MELIAASPDRARPGPDRRGQALPGGDGPHRPGDGPRRSRGRRAAARHARDGRQGGRALAWWPTGACAAATTPRCSGPPSGCWPTRHSRRRRVPAVHRGQEGPELLPLPGPARRAVVHRHQRAPHLHRRPRGGRRRPHPVRQRRGRPGDDGLHPVPLGRSARRSRFASSSRWSIPGRRRPSDEADEQPAASRPRAPASDGPHGYTEFEPDAAILLETLAPRAAETEIFAALLEASASEPPPASGPWPRPPTTPAS